MNRTAVKKRKGRNAYKRRGNYNKSDTGNWDSKNLAMGRDIYRSHVRYGEGILSVDDIDSIPGIESLLEKKKGE
jgi:hypothetical protein